MNTTIEDHIRPVDQSVLDLLRQRDGMTVQELISNLEVTATAVRQRLDRLSDAGLIERRKESTGRGRPQFRYVLTSLGRRYASASYSDLATALWQEILDLPNPMQRSRILRRVARRMARELNVPEDGDVTERFEAVASELEKRKVPIAVRSKNKTPFLEVLACPYPELTADDHSRHLCEMEQEMLSTAVGQELRLDCCQLDGHRQCQFRPLETPPQPVADDTDPVAVDQPQRQSSPPLAEQIIPPGQAEDITADTTSLESPAADDRPSPTR